MTSDTVPAPVYHSVRKYKHRFKSILIFKGCLYSRKEWCMSARIICHMVSHVPCSSSSSSAATVCFRITQGGATHGGLHRCATSTNERTKDIYLFILHFRTHAQATRTQRTCGLYQGPARDRFLTSGPAGLQRYFCTGSGNHGTEFFVSAGSGDHVTERFFHN